MLSFYEWMKEDYVNSRLHNEEVDFFMDVERDSEAPKDDSNRYIWAVHLLNMNACEEAKNTFLDLFEKYSKYINT